MESHTQIHFFIEGKLPGAGTKREHIRTDSPLQRQKEEIHAQEYRPEYSGPP